MEWPLGQFVLAAGLGGRTFSRSSLRSSQPKQLQLVAAERAAARASGRQKTLKSALCIRSGRQNLLPPKPSARSTASLFLLCMRLERQLELPLRAAAEVVSRPLTSQPCFIDLLLAFDLLMDGLDAFLDDIYPLYFPPLHTTLNNNQNLPQSSSSSRKKRSGRK